MHGVVKVVIDWRKQGRNEGRREGREEGRKEGKKEGRKGGGKEGRKEGRPQCVEDESAAAVDDMGWAVRSKTLLHTQYNTVNSNYREEL